MGLNPLLSTVLVIEWFKKIPNKDKSKFLQFDIDCFYPSITEEALIAALDFAIDFCEISEDEKSIIMEARRSYLVSNKEIWVKKVNFSFDVTMGAYDGAELCELIGLFLLSKIKKIKDLECGLYMGDVLSVSTLPNREKEHKIKKNQNWYFQQRQSQNNL